MATSGSKSIQLCACKAKACYTGLYAYLNGFVKAWSQFKNCFIGGSINRLLRSTVLKLTSFKWQRTSFDAIGGTVKCQVATKVMQQRASVKDFFCERFF